MKDLDLDRDRDRDIERESRRRGVGDRDLDRESRMGDGLREGIPSVLVRRLTDALNYCRFMDGLGIG